jgi:hypothetical protein
MVVVVVLALQVEPLVLVVAEMAEQVQPHQLLVVQ